MTQNSKTNSSIGRLNRRTLLKAAGATGLASAMNVPLANIARGAGNTIKIGWVGCLSGVRAPFAEPDTWIHERIKARLKDGLKIGGKTWQVEFVFKDNQSDPNRSSVVASELVLREKCDLILIEDGDAQAPVQELADARGIPSISTMVPWQGWMFPRKSTPDKGFPYSYHFFWGADDVVKNFLGMWQSVETNKKVGTLYIDNPAGQAFSDPKVGLPGGITQAGYQEFSAGKFQIATDDFTNQVSSFKNNGVDIVSGFTYGNHWVTLWNQAAQAGFKPQICTVAAAFLFPSAVNALGDRGDGMSTEVWWTPAYPFKSSLTGQSAAELAAEWEKTTGKQWTQPIGYAHALWEVALAALQNSDPKDKNSLRDAIAGLDMETVVGPVKFKGTPIKNVAVTSLSGGQWRKTRGGKAKYELLIVHNGTAPFIPKQADLALLSKLA
ncbi:ABC transporter substrate-binding protein [Bradyrhizobium quebecense]|uniref:ABC transporter substrate-binding protein n=2 Tax=Bradyrhizobium quebecense TaxID=2748629 RepID=A0ACD3V6T8_9BRAD|nr:ABC transporter substrate-binding protein [Bradyrhizobium quebecense]UGY02078.1 ABC transporter substrate-binding protein [Bradyrhizobium quebecense]